MNIEKRMGIPIKTYHVSMHDYKTGEILAEEFKQRKPLFRDFNKNEVGQIDYFLRIIELDAKKEMYNIRKSA